MKKFILVIALCLLPLAVGAQEQKSEKEREKEFYEAIEKQIERLTTLLDLEDWQVFYVDSILTHDYTALQEEFKSMGQAKVSNTDLFQDAQDKWSEKIYQAFHKVFDEDQWTKYLKSGAAKDKKARDKRAAKRSK